MFVNAPLEPATRTKPVVSGDLASLLQNSAGPAHARSGAENMEKTVGWVILVASLFLFCSRKLARGRANNLIHFWRNRDDEKLPKGTPASVGLDEETLKNLDADMPVESTL